MADEQTKNPLPRIGRFFITFFQIILFIPIQIVFIPFAIIGIIIAIKKEFGNSKKLGVSFSAIKALQYRWFMHNFNTRPDPLTIAFIKKFPCESHFGLWTTFGPLIIAQRLFGFTTGLGKIEEPGKENYVSTAARRVLEFDGIMEKHVEKMEQVVLLGVGFDLLALHFTEGKKVKVFELDQDNTINIKVETLKKAQIKHDWITYVPVNYAQESWSEKLVKAGFDRTKKTLFIWQSVSLFLEADLVKETLKDMADLCIDGSIVAQDIYSKSFCSGEYSKIVKKQRNVLKQRGETWKFGLDMSQNPKGEIESFLTECRLKMTHYIQFGEKLDIEPFYCIVEAKKHIL